EGVHLLRRGRQAGEIDVGAAREGSGVGGHWWDVAIAEVSPKAGVKAARKAYETARKAQKLT
ncbi:MAG TPA: hypothetical protein PLE50_10055, partial [Rhabdaerophilum sp.]|nr:hypothetical protein [Rhabdaerophilum sp.]